MFLEYRYEHNRIVARFKDGSMIKGFTQDFIPMSDTFTIMPARNADDISEIRITDLKALFFVKTFEGNKDYTEKITFDIFDSFGLPGLKVKCEFYDGEVIRGMSYDYSKHYRGFFMIPVDPQSNNEMIYVLSNSLIGISVGSEAEK